MTAVRITAVVRLLVGPQRHDLDPVVTIPAEFVPGVEPEGEAVAAPHRADQRGGEDQISRSLTASQLIAGARCVHKGNGTAMLTNRPVSVSVVIGSMIFGFSTTRRMRS